MRISVIGLGKLGAPLAACFAACGHQVVGVDLNEQTLEAIQARRAPVVEPGLDDLLERTEGRLTATADLANAVGQTDITFVLVPTPSQPDGAFSLRHVLSAVQSIARALAAKDAFHVVVITSTVMPGDTGGRIRQALEKGSGKRCGSDFGLCYSPEFIALGSVIRDLQNPDFVLIGESDSHSGGLVSEAVLSLCEHQPPVLRMSLVNAELAKIAINTFVTTKISFANMLGELCERLDGGDVDAVTRAVGADCRIGPRYLKAGLGYGGPCFPRDNRALAALAGQLKVRTYIPRATDRVNRHQARRLQRIVQAHLPAGGTVGILGLTYKSDTPVTEEAQGLELAQRLAAEDIAVVAFDPFVNAAVRQQLPARLVNSVVDCAHQADVLVLCTPCREFLALNDYRRDERDFRDLTIIDCWRVLDGERLADEINHVPLGRFRWVAGSETEPAGSLPARAFHQQ